jgi:hypothetical protein
MPTVTETTVDGFVSCTDPRCVGYKQKPTAVLRQLVAFTYGDNGGDGSIPLGAIERESVYVMQTDDPCEHCGKPTIRTDSERPEYAQVSGQDPLELLAINQQTQIRDVQMRNLEAAKENAELKAQLAQQGKILAEIQGELTRRKGGRPPKDPDGDAA